MNGQAQRAPHGAASLSHFPPVKQEDAPAYTPLNAYGAYAPFQGVQFGDLELAESLGWPAQGASYGQGYEGEYRLAQGPAATAAVSAMSAHEGSRHGPGQSQAQSAASGSNSAPTHAASGAHGVAQSFPPSGTSYNTMPIPHAASPAWSGLESPSFLAEPSPLSRDVNPVKPAGGRDKGALSDRKAMRRYSHNAVERRRRDNINESIHELSLLVPATLLGCAAPSSPPPQQASPAAGSATATASTAAAAAAKPNKGVVLRKSIEYIHMLKAEVERRNERAQVLEAEIERLGGSVPVEQIQVVDSPLSLWQDESAITEDES